MGTSKTEKFTAEQNIISSFAKALGHPARVAILEYLFKTKSCICGDIVEEIGLAQSTISQHLKELKKLGLIKGTVEGTSVCYCVNTEVWSEMKFVMNQFFDQDVQSNVECCDTPMIEISNTENNNCSPDGGCC